MKRVSFDSFLLSAATAIVIVVIVSPGANVTLPLFGLVVGAVGGAVSGEVVDRDDLVVGARELAKMQRT